MRLTYVSISDQAASTLRNDSAAAMQILQGELQCSGLSGGGAMNFLSAMFGGRSASVPVPKLGQRSGPGKLVRDNAVRGGLEKSWHALHFMFCGQPDVIPGEPSCALLSADPLSPGEQDSAQYLSAARVRDFRDSIANINEAEFERRFNVSAFEVNDIYPNIWDEDRDELLDEYLQYYRLLKKDLDTTIAANEGLLISLG